MLRTQSRGGGVPDALPSQGWLPSLVFLVTHQHAFSGDSAGQQEALSEPRSKGLIPTPPVPGLWKFQSERGCSSVFESVGSNGTSPAESGVQAEPVMLLFGAGGPAPLGLRPHSTSFPRGCRCSGFFVRFEEEILYPV